MAKRAFVCGINEYQSITRLRGCVNDVTNVRFALKEFAGFTNDEIRVLSDDRATQQAIVERLAWLVDGAQPGDLLVFHFSGHGAQVPDTDEQDELVDRMDEILCPWDMAWNERFISDDFLDRHLRVPAGAVLEVVLDCCNSGDGDPVSAPEDGEDQQLSPTPDRQPRFVRPPHDLFPRRVGGSIQRRRLLQRRPAARTCRWAACADSQTAADAKLDGLFNGAFTFHLFQVLRESQGRLPREEVLRQVRSGLAKDGFPQIPELAASPELIARPVFQL